MNIDYIIVKIDYFKMTKSILPFFLALMLAVSVKAQTKSNDGIFLKSSDYVRNQPTYALTKTDQLTLNEFFEGRNITFTSSGKKITLAKDSIFGYRQAGQDYRIQQMKCYHILDTAGFILYARSSLVSAGKSYKMRELYFFSVDCHSPINPLTKHNLYMAFHHQTDFRYAVERDFRDDDDLAEFDALDHQYKIKYLYHQHATTLAAH